MNMCQNHWDKLREAIKERGLGSLISENGEEVATKMVRELNEGQTVDTYDPLMAAYWSISSNGMDFIGNFGGNPLVLMVPEGQGQEEPYPRCVICYLNWMMDKHDEVCKDPNCRKPKGEAAHYDWMINRASDDQVQRWKDMQT